MPVAACEIGQRRKLFEGDLVQDQWVGRINGDDVGVAVQRLVAEGIVDRVGGQRNDRQIHGVGCHIVEEGRRNRLDAQLDVRRCIA
jgi:hypothetical protein